MEKRKKRIFALLFTGILLVTGSLFLAGCGRSAETFKGSAGGSRPAEDGEPGLSLYADGKGNTDIKIKEEKPEPEAGPETYELSLSAVGDNLIHRQILNRAVQGDGSYDFTPMYEHVEEEISSYDISVVNQETIFVKDKNRVGSYPLFGTPAEMGAALMDAGFDVVLGATNHTWDQGETGVADTLEYWSGHPEVTLLGLHGSEEDYGELDIISRNNIDLAMFNYTYGLNGFSLPADKPYLVDILDNKKKFIGDVKEVEGQVDFTVCFLHIGVEYVYKPTDFQTAYINDLIDAGADLVICAHPHVIEPYQMVTTEEGNTGLVYYSCGNFISGQDRPERMLGGMASVKLTKTVQGGEVIDRRIAEYDFIPVVTHYNSRVHTVYFLEDYTDELAAQHALGVSKPGLQKLWDEVTGGKPDDGE